MSEEVLSRTLCKLGLEKQEVDKEVQKREGGSQARASTPSRSSSRPAGTWRGQQGHSWHWGSSSSQWQWRSGYW